jgi:hypothetical protein
MSTSVLTAAASHLAGAGSGRDRVYSAILGEEGRSTTTNTVVAEKAAEGGGGPGADGGMRMKKAVQQDEANGPLDDAEREVIEQRRRARIAGTSATARANYHGGGAPLQSAHGHHYSARSIVRPASPTKAARVAAQTARREEEQRTRRENERAQRERARKAALRAAQRRREEEQREREARVEERRARQAAQEYAGQRERMAEESRLRAGVPALNALKIAPQQTEKQIRRQKRRNRPEWGEGHAGGNRLQLGQKSVGIPPPPREQAWGAVDDPDRNMDRNRGGYEEEVEEEHVEPRGLAGSAGLPFGLGSTAAAPPVAGLTKLALPSKPTEYKGFQQWQEWKWSPAQKPKATQATGHSRPREVWRTDPPGEDRGKSVGGWGFSPADTRGPPVNEQELPSGRLNSGILGWFMGAVASEEEGDSDVGRSETTHAAHDDGEWSAQLARASPSQLASLLTECGSSDAKRTYECLSAARAMLVAAAKRKKDRARSFDSSPHVLLTRAGFAGALCHAMRSHPTNELVQFGGCEVIGLLANNYYGLEQKICDAGGTEVCLAAIESWLSNQMVAEEVIGVAFQAIHNLCFIEELNDKPGCARKQAAVELGALETISASVQEAREKWVQQAGKMVIGCLCKGADKDAATRRKRAHALFKLNANMMK